MTLQQLHYVIRAAQCGSINLAAKELFLSQPSLSNAISDLEQEFGITIFLRNRQGVSLTEEGSKFLSYARQVTQQADLLLSKFKSTPVRRLFAVSAQHYAFAVNAFVALVKEFSDQNYEFSLRETRTSDILDDVRSARSELGILFLSNFNRDVILAMLKKADLVFSPLFTAKPHIFVSRHNPLASLKVVTPEQLLPFPRLSFEQGVNNSFYFSEELMSHLDCPKSIIVSDRATLFNLLIGLNGYTISSGVLSQDLNGSEIVSVPLKCDDCMQIGFISPKDRPLSAAAERYLYHLKEYISNY